MTDLPQTITEFLDRAKNLIEARRLDLERTLTMLDALPDDIGETGRSVEQAQHAAAAAGQDSRYEAMARFALARVIVELEKRVAEPGPATRPRLLFNASGTLNEPTFGDRTY